jgi:hypothetical protein
VIVLIPLLPFVGRVGKAHRAPLFRHVYAASARAGVVVVWPDPRYELSTFLKLLIGAPALF